MSPWTAWWTSSAAYLLGHWNGQKPALSSSSAVGVSLVTPGCFTGGDDRPVDPEVFLDGLVDIPMDIDEECHVLSNRIQGDKPRALSRPNVCSLNG